MTPEVETLPAVRTESVPVRAEDFMPLFTVQKAVERKEMMNQFISKVLKEDEDYGKIPGGQTKKVLMKPGAEKLCSIFGLSPKYCKEVIIEDWTGAQHADEPLFSYEYRCQLWRGDRFMGEAIGSCNSWESKYRYRWVQEEAVKDRADLERLPRRGGVVTRFEPLFALEKKQTEGQYGKPTEYWQAFDRAIESKMARFIAGKQLGKKKFDGWEMDIDTVQYRIPNPDVADVVNTCQKMAQKRALVAAVLVVTNCSDAFTQDLEEELSEDHHTPQSIPKEKAKPGQANLDTILSKVTDKTSAIRAAEAIKKGIRGLTGDDKDYYSVLGAHGWEHFNEFRELAEAKAALTEIYWRGCSISEKQSEMGPEPPVHGDFR